MNPTFPISIALLSSALALGAGTIRGVVTAEGKTVANESADGGKYDSRKLKFAQRINYAELRDFVVFIEGPTGYKPTDTNQTVRVDTKRVNQQGAMFTPHVLPVVAGTTVEWPNNDNIYHNVFSMSEAKPFDLGLYKNPEVKRVTFDKAGRVDVFCSIHANMSCVVVVLENPWFAVADEHGRYAITNVPAGPYQLKAWHERLPPQSQSVTVTETGDVKVDFKLGINNLPKY
jgi:plastocyanin